jgi:hypothetical protein
MRTPREFPGKEFPGIPEVSPDSNTILASHSDPVSPICTKNCTSMYLEPRNKQITQLLKIRDLTRIPREFPGRECSGITLVFPEFLCDNGQQAY